jgi:protein subunit release factor A
MKQEISKNNQLVQDKHDQNTALFKEEIKAVQAEMKKNTAQLEAMMAVLQTLKPVQPAE